MKFIETRLRRAYIIELEPMSDKRGFFARSFCKEAFKKHGLKHDVHQCNISNNKRKGTLRGMHYQVEPHKEAKLVSCVKGKIFDVIVDLRQDSPTYRKWFSVILSEKNRKMLYIPEGFAHGYQTLEDNTLIYYRMFEFYHPESQRGLRWNDPNFAIKWPKSSKRYISGRDKGYADFKP